MSAVDEGPKWVADLQRWITSSDALDQKAHGKIFVRTADDTHEVEHRLLAYMFLKDDISVLIVTGVRP